MKIEASLLAISTMMLSAFLIGYAISLNESISKLRSDNDMLLNAIVNLSEECSLIEANYSRSREELTNLQADNDVLKEELRLVPKDITVRIEPNNFRSKNYEFIFLNRIDGYWGFTTLDGRIFLLNGRDIDGLYETCNHEILHNVVARDEAWVEENDDYFHFPECIELRERINEKIAEEM